jgi:hypothetical protein
MGILSGGARDQRNLRAIRTHDEGRNDGREAQARGAPGMVPGQ